MRDWKKPAEVPHVSSSQNLFEAESAWAVTQ